MSWEQAWLNYRKVNGYDDKEYLKRIVVQQKKGCTESAVDELKCALAAMFNIVPEIIYGESDSKGVHLKLLKDEYLGEEGYRIQEENGNIVISGNTDRAVLYGVFELIRTVVQEKRLKGLDKEQIPSNPLRMINHWDNIDGSIERGYSGESFYFKNGEIIVDQRTVDYARLMSSVGINAIVINNVNVLGDATALISDRYFEKLTQIARIFKSYGIKLLLSLNYAAPIELGGLNTADPLDQGVISWWQKKAEEVFKNIPNFGGFLVKADSEGRPGPFTYGRDHAEGANMLAKAVKPYDGIIIWRCFVYNCQQDWRDLKTDRAKAGYDNFMPLDGNFDDNVILQIKNGPMDFQVREPISPLFGSMKKTNQILEVQIAQEYTGQQRHVCYLIPMFKEVLEFRTHCGVENDTVAEIISGKTYNTTLCGFSAVTNTGDDENWTGHDFAAANLYGYGRLAWDTDLSSEAIAEEWIRMTYSNKREVISSIQKILMMSWPAYEKYTSPLGIGWMVNPSHHYGPNVDGYEYDRWGTYHRATHATIGVDRTTKGTGYTTQYFEPNMSMYECIDSCPEELLLFFHKVPYTYKLKSGVSLIQHIYDTHFEGVDDVEEMVTEWKSMKEYVDSIVYERALERLEGQLEHSKEWRDVINSYFYRKTLIDDENNRTIY